ncbi:ANTAR domain-containing protein [Pseudonocardia parietis]|uniref:ANTAR domain-containing protein n=1 Tax=Pseudonocardia parietis TaxID=570936 RepID=A0ABS4W6Y1_9PSEU|nr:ANTAR domain-containing protein [Pseudonocardia parietis]MBP2371946.1 hypothetical protein [Pseudonocardia parietis]
MDRQRRQQLWREVLAAGGATGSDGCAHAVCVACVAELASVDAAALSLRTASRSEELHGASDEWAARLEQLQYTLGEGPGMEALTAEEPVLIDTLSEQAARWPGFVGEAGQAGLGAVFAFALRAGAIRVGTLTLYRRRPGGLGVSEALDAAVLAELAAAVVIDQFARAQRAGRDAPRPLVSYQDVHIATGMLAARLGLSLDDAFTRLRAHAYGQDRSILELAHDLVHRRIDLDQLAE